MATTAEQLYAGYGAALGPDSGLLPWSELIKRPEHRAWFAVANAVAKVAEIPSDVVEPYEYDLLVEVEPRTVKTVQAGNSAVEGKVTIREKLPTSLTIRPSVAGDLCCREFDQGNAAFNSAIFAHIHGVELKMYLDRLSPVDVKTAQRLVAEAKGTEAWMVMMGEFMDAGGALLTASGGTLDHDADGWMDAAFVLLAKFSEARGGYYTLTLRGGVEMEIGPLRVRHLNAYQDAVERMTEWDARIETLAQICSVDPVTFRNMRIEDATRAWRCVEMLKKKAELEAAARVLSVRASRRSAQSTGGAQTSKSSPSGA